MLSTIDQYNTTLCALSLLNTKDNTSQKITSTLSWFPCIGVCYCSLRFLSVEVSDIKVTKTVSFRIENVFFCTKSIIQEGSILAIEKIKRKNVSKNSEISQKNHTLTGFVFQSGILEISQKEEILFFSNFAFCYIKVNSNKWLTNYRWIIF